MNETCAKRSCRTHATEPVDVFELTVSKAGWNSLFLGRRWNSRKTRKICKLQINKLQEYKYYSLLFLKTSDEKGFLSQRALYNQKDDIFNFPIAMTNIIFRKVNFP